MRASCSRRPRGEDADLAQRGGTGEGAAGRSGRPSKSLTLEEAKSLLAAAEPTRLHAYVMLSLLVGIRTEEARRCAGTTW
jgi:integrase